MEHITVDEDELAEQMKKDCMENGYCVHIYMPPITQESIENEDPIYPIIDVGGKTNHLMMALTVMALRDVENKILKRYKEVREVLEELGDLKPDREIYLKGDDLVD